MELGSRLQRTLSPLRASRVRGNTAGSAAQSGRASDLERGRSRLGTHSGSQPASPLAPHGLPPAAATGPGEAHGSGSLSDPPLKDSSSSNDSGHGDLLTGAGQPGSPPMAAAAGGGAARQPPRPLSPFESTVSESAAVEYDAINVLAPTADNDLRGSMLPEVVATAAAQQQQNGGGEELAGLESRGTGAFLARCAGPPARLLLP
jgi:hypothetical protein